MKTRRDFWYRSTRISPRRSSRLMMATVVLCAPNSVCSKRSSAVGQGKPSSAALSSAANTLASCGVSGGSANAGRIASSASRAHSQTCRRRAAGADCSSASKPQSGRSFSAKRFAPPCGSVSRVEGASEAPSGARPRTARFVVDSIVSCFQDAPPGLPGAGRGGRVGPRVTGASPPVSALARGTPAGDQPTDVSR